MNLTTHQHRSCSKIVGNNPVLVLANERAKARFAFAFAFAMRDAAVAALQIEI